MYGASGAAHGYAGSGGAAPAAAPPARRASKKATIGTGGAQSGAIQSPFLFGCACDLNFVECFLMDGFWVVLCRHGLLLKAVL